MKALNTMMFVSNAVQELTEYKTKIAAAETYEDAKNTARGMMGYIDCLVTFLNTMICKENNDFTAELDDVLNDWMAKMYQAIADKAIETDQPHDVVLKLLQKRDEYRA